MEYVFKVLVMLFVGAIGGIWMLIAALARGCEFAAISIGKVLRRKASRTAPDGNQVEPAKFSALPQPAYLLTPIADYFINVVFNKSFIATLSVYNASGTVKRSMRPRTPAAEAVMRKVWNARKWQMADMVISDALSIDDIVMCTEEEGNVLLQRLLSETEPQFQSQIQRMLVNSIELPPLPAVRGGSETSSPMSSPLPEASPVIAPVLDVPTVTSSSHSPADSRKTLQKRVSKIVGYVVDMGMRGISNFATFEATIADEVTGESSSFRGVRLQEAFTKYAVALGDKVSLEQLEPTKVNGTGNKRNEYELRLLKKAKEIA